MSKNKITNKNLVDYILAVALGILIIFFAIIKQQSFIKTLPTLITLFVQILMVKASRYAFLIGGINCLLYGLSYFSEGLYFSTLSAVAISFPLMLFSYFNWKKKSSNASPSVLFLKNSSRLIILFGIIVVWLLCAKFLGNIISGGRFIWLDCFCFVGGVTVTTLSAFRYVDSQYLNILCCTISLLMWTVICIETPSNINFAIIAVYNLYKVTQTAISWTKFSKIKE